MENLVKTWEAQASHYINFTQWTTIDHSNYNVSSNGGDIIPGKTAYEIGNYNFLMGQCPVYKKCKYLCLCPCADLEVRQNYRWSFQ